MTTEISNLEKDIETSLAAIPLEEITSKLKQKKQELNEIIENKMKGIILRSKCQHIQNNEKNTKYFSSLEKKQAEKKVISKLNIDNNIITDIKNILKVNQLLTVNYTKKRNTRVGIYFV